MNWRGKLSPLGNGILAVSIALSLMIWWISDRIADDLSLARFEQQAAFLEAKIAERMQAYEQVLVGGVSLMRVNPQTTREDWKTYVSRLRLDELYPGIQGMGFAVPVAREEREAHIAAIRREGFPDYTIRPETERDEYSVIVYLEPLNWRNQRAFGFDMWSNEVRREAMRKARDSGKAHVSGGITLEQETESDVQKGFVYYLPFFDPTVPLDTVEQRQGGVYRMGLCGVSHG